MYTEMYTSQVIEGAPSYQVNGNPGEDGVEVEEGASGEDEPDEETPQTPLSFRKILSIILLCLYVCLILYLILEIQRAVRCRLRKQKKHAMEGGGQVFIDQYVKEIEGLFLIGKVAGNYDHPTELSVQIEEKIPGISRDEYDRVVQLLQKVRFGGKHLLPYEIHTLDCFGERLLQALFRQKGVWGKFKMRYWYALPIRR